MATWSFSNFPFIGLLSLFLTLLYHPLTAATATMTTTIPVFREAPAFRNGDSCASPGKDYHIHVAMTLDANYLRGTMAAVFSILQHSTCPENVVFHFLSAKHEPQVLSSINKTFPFLNFKVYSFNTTRIHRLISKSIRQALDQPINFARVYLANTLSSYVKRVIYLDSDLIMVDDIAKLWSVDLEDKVVGAPEYCHANLTKYFTDSFWFDPFLSTTFEGRKPCYFNTGVMVMDLEKWRDGKYSEKIENWMLVQKQKRIYDLGSLPPFLLVFAGNIKGIDHRWNQHGLGGDNVEGKCRGLHPGHISLLHWSGKGKPWLRLDSKKPCIIDHLWAPYDLHNSFRHSFEE